MVKSILQTNKECYICRELCGFENTQNLHLHHIYEGNANRRQSDKYGFTAYLCGRHHNLSNEGIHFDQELDLWLKKRCQEKFEENHSREEFMQIIGRNYL